jgi:ABC-type dipeptide/oligopeptide/nickel transport system permease component
MKVATLLAAVACLALTAWLGKFVYGELMARPAQYLSCSDREGHYDSRKPEQLASFHNCIDREAKLFLDRDYADAKDLIKAFLTLLSATLVASITFSEKIVDVSKAELLPLIVMITCWMLLLAAIVLCGSGLFVLASAAGIAAAAPEYSISPRVSRGALLVSVAGITFVLALIAMVVAGIASLMQKRRASASKPYVEAAWTWT